MLAKKKLIFVVDMLIMTNNFRMNYVFFSCCNMKSRLNKYVEPFELATMDILNFHDFPPKEINLIRKTQFKALYWFFLYF